MRWLGESLQSFLDRTSQTLDEALDLKFPQGGMPWWREEANRTRDDALRRLAGEHFADATTAATLKEIHAMSVRYAASAWRFDRERAAMPNRYAGAPKAHLWAAFKSGATMPLGERQLRNILAV